MGETALREVGLFNGMGKTRRVVRLADLRERLFLEMAVALSSVPPCISHYSVVVSD